MGRQKLFLGVFIGAIVGGLASLADRDTRSYTKLKLKNAKNGSNYYVKHPSEAVKVARDSFDKVNKQFATGTENAIKALDQAESSLDKFSKRKEQQESDNTL